MDKNQFKSFCKREFEERGFKNIKNIFYLLGQDLLCGIYLQKSNYGNTYYINYDYFIGIYTNFSVLPTRAESDISGRFLAMSKRQTVQGKTFMTTMIEYEEYTEDELRPLFDIEFQEKILPPIYQGKKYIFENLNKLYFLGLNQEEVMFKLQNNTVDG